MSSLQVLEIYYEMLQSRLNRLLPHFWVGPMTYIISHSLQNLLSNNKIYYELNFY